MITNQVDKQSYSGNGSNVNFAIPFTIVVNDINETGVILRDISDPASPIDTLLTYGAGQNYILTGSNPPTQPFNNNVQLAVAPTANQIVVVFRVMPLTQVLNMVANGFDYSNLNVVHDRIVAMAQVLLEVINRCPQLAIATQRTAPDYIPEPQANTILGYDANKKLTLLASDQGGTISGVASLNGLQGLLNLLAGTGISISVSGQSITVSNNGGAWGSITGTIASQTDLVAYVGARVAYGI